MPTPYRHVTPVPRSKATGRVAAVYDQSRRELGALFSPHLSPAPDVHAAAWAALRESQLVGSVPRARKEAVAAAVSVANRCPFCADAHAVLIHATGEHLLAEAILHGRAPADPADVALVGWATATRTPGSPLLATPPFTPDVAAEYIGTALVNHFINRMMDLLRPDPLLPDGPVLGGMARRAAGMALRHTVRRRHLPGESLALLEETAPPPAHSAVAVPDWAGDTPVGLAFAALSAAARRGAALLGDAARVAVVTTVGRWDGAHLPLASSWLDDPLADVPLADRPGARLALLAALAPYRVTDADVAAWRAGSASDANLVRLLTFGAVTAVEHLATGVTAGAAQRSR